jgi:hypothetical protein
VKSRLVLLAVAALLMLSTAGAQTFNDYVASFKGDTAVIKDYNDKAQEASTLTSALTLDSIAVPAGRVYMLKTNGYYPLLSSPTTTGVRPIVIMGEPTTRLVQATDANSAPPVVCGYRSTASSNTGGFTFSGSLTFKNCNIIPGISDGTLGWAFFGTGAPDSRLVLDNDLIERTRWVEIQSNAQAGFKMYIKDCYFVNLSGQPCRRNGGVYDNVNNNTDTMWVENTTHILAQGSLYKFRNYQINKIIFNHNTFISCAGSVFESQGYVSDMTITNNIFVNCNVQAFGDSIGNNEDKGEVDPHWLPTGIVNLDTLPDTYVQMARKVLVDKNVIYWDPKFNDIVTTLKTNNINGDQTWVSQMITMNSRTQAMFNDNTNYPYLTEGTWITKKPTFVKPGTLLTGWVDSVKVFATKTVDIAGLGTAAVLSAWRDVLPSETYYVYSDWPIPVNLAYTDTDLLTAGTSGFPVGDLNWFPTQKASWAAQRSVEYAKLQWCLDHGTTGVENQVSGTPEVYSLGQNYPNPFNPSTTISYALPHAGNVTLKVYNMLGQEVATLVNGQIASGTHEVKFDAKNLASGTYYYRLTSGDFTQVQKMLLVK